MRPFRVNADVWRLLRYHNLCRTPQEEQKHRLLKSQEVAVPDSIFAKNLDWMLRCCLLSYPRTQGIQIKYVSGEGLGIDVALHDSTVGINERFLTYAGSHGDEVCGEAEPSDTHPFACDHVAIQLWDNILSFLPDTTDHASHVTDEPRLKSMVAKRLAQMVRSVECKPRGRRELQVSWKSTESQRQNKQPVNVALHDPTCSRFRAPSNELYDSKGITSLARETFADRFQIRDANVPFDQLYWVPLERYFPISKWTASTTLLCHGLSRVLSTACHQRASHLSLVTPRL